MQKLENVRKFPGFNRRLKEFKNTGSSFGNIEAMILFYLMDYIDFCGHNKPYGGNTIKIDRTFKNTMINALCITDGNISKALNKFYKAGVLYKIKNGLYQLNPWLAAKGRDADVIWLRRYGVFKEYVIGQNTTVFRDKYDILKIIQEDALSDEQLENGETDGLNKAQVLEIYRMLESIKLLTSQEISALMNHTFEFPKNRQGNFLKSLFTKNNSHTS